jgi:asparagine synthase (glutamine-hydrolysing)
MPPLILRTDETMCGITGILSFRGEPTSPQQVEAMTRLLSHRGPDGDNTWFSNRVGFGHSRLAVLDLEETGRQPMSYLGGRFWITYNGEVYNFLELRDELEALGHRFRSTSDTEVVLAAFAEWGQSCQLRFNGMWAFAIWDSQEKRLFMSRDRFGVKPLFFFSDDRRFAFASEVKAFLALPWFPADFDLAAVSCSLLDPYALESGERCLLSGLRRLMPGHSLTVTADGKAKPMRWWRTEDHLEVPPTGFEDQVEEFRLRLVEAARLRMRSDIPVAYSLSGGLDSSSVVGALIDAPESPSRKRQRDAHTPTAFIASFPGTSHDELPEALEVALAAGVETRPFTVEPDDLPDLFDAIVYHGEEVQSPNLGPWMVYRAMAQSGIRVSLEGHGGDELLAGYERHVSFALDRALFPIPHPGRALELAGILRGMAPHGRQDGRLWDALSAGKRLTRLVQLSVRPWVARGDHRGQKTGVARWLRVQPLQLHEAPPSAPIARLEPLTSLLFSDFHAHSIPTILRDYDRYSMAHGVEVRSPFMDWRVVCYGFSLPSRSVLGGGYTKRILREAMRGRMPESVRTRRTKIPFKSPMDEWWRGPLRDFVWDTVASASFLASECWDGPQIRTLVESNLGSARFGSALMVSRFVVAHRLMELFQSARRSCMAA